MVWFGKVWPGMVWYGLDGLVWPGMVWYGMTKARHDSSNTQCKEVVDGGGGGRTDMLLVK